MPTIRRLPALVAALALLSGCEPPPIMATDVPAAIAPPSQGVDRQLIEWCRTEADSSEERCRCWPAALRANGFTDQDLREVLVRVGAVDGPSDNRSLPDGFENATLSCGLWEPIGRIQASKE